MKRLLMSSASVLWLAAGVLLSSNDSLGEESARKTVRVGFVDPNSPSVSMRATRAFSERMRELGYVEGQNLIMESRSAEGRIDRLPELMNAVIGRKVDVLVTFGTPAAVAAKNATSTIPIVVAAMGDPLGTGLASSLAHPGGNLTGLSLEMTEDLSGKWLEVLHEVVPRLSTVAIISNPDSSLIANLTKHLEAAARKRGLKLRFIDVREPGALSSAFKQARREAQAALVLPDPLTMVNRRQITELAAANRLPSMYLVLEFMESGGLIVYAVDPAVMFRRAADYVDKILKGANPGDLPIEQPTQFSLTVNLKTARALGLTIPESILLRADEVIR